MTSSIEIHDTLSSASVKRVLILFAHPSQQRSEVNVPMFHAAQRIDGVTCVDLYGEYPTYNIDIDKEQRRLLDHDVILFHFPLYWYSTPAILKEWQDLVLEYGFAYGTKGNALKGKTFLCAISAGGRETAYRHDGINHFTVRELLAPLEQMANLTQMDYLPPFMLYGARSAQEEQTIDGHIALWQTLLQQLQTDTLPFDTVREAATLNAHILPAKLGGSL
ncbi:flavodoxin family protein [Vibrio sp. SM6]|uniref:Flavodoxin family protein n=1 Tax=Vibrio agarilyticus TaxID=2726741 RepID=A0A7X8TPK3_9VIBR|nr:NAD(P)H-dependent oxidoreductase [Vibrio agarilyticus]NLS11878.1 flavodoxin family protein [Vibrio agarilyticus]